MVYSKLWSCLQFRDLSDKAKLLYIGMITLADDDGRLLGDPAYLRGQIFTFDDISLKLTAKLRQEIIDVGLVTYYETDGDWYIEHPNWKDYQMIRGDLYKPSSLPSRNGSVTETEQKSSLSKDKISKDKIIDTTATELFEIFWSEYPNKVKKSITLAKWKKIDPKLYEKIIADVKERKAKDQAWLEEDGKYIPHPTTYLNQQRWEDEIKKPRSKVGSMKF